MTELLSEGVLWKPIPGFPGYYASSTGRVRGPKGGILLGSESNGYRRVTLTVDGCVTSKGVHWCVCSAFHGAPPGDGIYEPDHVDRDTLNNTPGNLRWLTLRDNRSRADVRKNDSHPKVRITQAQAERMLRETTGYADDARFAAEFGVQPRTIALIRLGHKRKHLTRPSSERRGSDFSGEGHRLAKLTEDDVRVIRARYVKHSQEHGSKPLAGLYGVNQATILQIVNGDTWRHV